MPLVTRGVSGTLPGTVTIAAAVFFNELLQGITLGTAPLVSTDKPGDALLDIEFDGSLGGRLLTTRQTTPAVALSAEPANVVVAEPATGTLISVTLAFMFGAYAVRARPGVTLRLPVAVAHAGPDEPGRRGAWCCWLSD